MASTQKSRDLKSGKTLIAFLIVLLYFVVFAKINGAFGNEDIHGVNRLLEHFFCFFMYIQCYCLYQYFVAPG